MSQAREASISRIAEASAKLSPVALRRLLDYALRHLADESLERVSGMAIAILRQSEGKRQTRSARLAKPVQESWRIGS